MSKILSHPVVSHSTAVPKAQTLASNLASCGASFLLFTGFLSGALAIFALVSLTRLF